MHLVDTTLFYSPTSGGIKRYLDAKHAWLAAHTSWEHTMVVPGPEDRIDRGGVCTLGGFVVPGSFNYRLPLNPERWTDLLTALEPSLIEAGDAFRNLVHDLKLPLFFVIGVRSYVAHQKGTSTDTCPVFLEPLIRTWKIPYTLLESQHTAADLAAAYRQARDAGQAAAVLLAE